MSSASLIAAVSVVNDLLTTALAFTTQAQHIGSMIQGAHTAGRELTKEEWDMIYAQHDVARQVLADMLSKHDNA